MADHDHRLIRQCWANKIEPGPTGYTQRCLERVPNDPAHIGLCDDCRDRLRDLPACASERAA